VKSQGNPPSNAVSHKKGEPTQILVTGAAGFIAFHLVENLLREGKAVLGVDCLDPYYPVALKRKNLADLKRIAREVGAPFRFIEGPLHKITSAILVDHHVDTVVHLAAKAGVRPSQERPIEYVEINITETTRLLERCRKVGIKNFIFGSSSSVYGRAAKPPFKESDRVDEPLSVYGASKRAGELLVSTFTHLYGMKSCALRFFTVYGPRQRPDLAIRKFVKAAIEGTSITLFADPRGGRDYTYVTDIVAGIRHAMNFCSRSPNGTFEIFNLGNNRLITPEMLVDRVELATGCELKIERSSMVPGDMGSTLADITKSESVLGYRPEVSFEEGMQRFVDWFLSMNETKSKKAA